MMMPGRKYDAGNGYRYGFNGKENDNEVKGDGNQQDYGMRIYDPRLGRFLSVDPMIKTYPYLSPYIFAENDVISSIDLDGLEKYKIVGRSFAPTNSFLISHFESKGDGRSKFSKEGHKKVSARIHVQITVNMSDGYFLRDIESQPTIDKAGNSWPITNQHLELNRNSTINAYTYNKRDALVDGNYSAKNGMNFGPGIDIQFQIYMNSDRDKMITTIRSRITGNKFPAQETLIFDEKGTGLFLGASTAMGGPLTNVWGTGEDNVLSTAILKIAINENGDFMGVYTKDKNGNEVVQNPDAYNKQFLNKDTWYPFDKVREADRPKPKKPSSKGRR